MNVKDRTILITGANRGIGRALLEEALKRGVKQVYAGTRQSFTHSDSRVVPLTLDITDPNHIQAAAKEVESLDLLINNAGRMNPRENLNDRVELEGHLDVNLFGTFYQMLKDYNERARATGVQILLDHSYRIVHETTDPNVFIVEIELRMQSGTKESNKSVVHIYRLEDGQIKLLRDYFSLEQSAWPNDAAERPKGAKGDE